MNEKKIKIYHCKKINKAQKEVNYGGNEREKIEDMQNHSKKAEAIHQ